MTKNQSTAVEAIDLPPKKTSANNYLGNLFLVKRFNKNNNKWEEREREGVGYKTGLQVSKQIVENLKFNLIGVGCFNLVI